MFALMPDKWNREANRKKFKELLSKIDLSGFPIPIQLAHCVNDYNSDMLHVQITVPHRETKKLIQVEQYSPLPLDMHDEELLRLIIMFVQSIIFHELKEHFLYGAERTRVFDPHKDRL